MAVTSLAARAIAVFDAPSAAPTQTIRALNPKTGDLVLTEVSGPDVAPDGELDLAELDLSMACFGAKVALDAVAFLRAVDANGNGTVDRAELEALIAAMDDLQRQSLGIKMDHLEAAKTAFGAARARYVAANFLTRPFEKRTLDQADDAFYAAKLDFVEHLATYAPSPKSN